MRVNLRIQDYPDCENYGNCYNDWLLSDEWISTVPVARV